MQQNLILEYLVTRWEANDLAKLVDIVLGSSYQDKSGHEEDIIEEKYAKVRSNVKQCLRKVVDGYFTPVVKMLGSSTVAPEMHIL